ncbi:MAG: hypothetical protein JWN15_4352 [Firmicutes bacterium]|nr:hypothetical protein [Bacillota bacterium]
MDQREFIISVLAKWVVTREDFETLFATELVDADVHGMDLQNLLDVAQQAFRRFKEADLAYFSRLRGDPPRLAREIAGALGW